MKQIIKLRILTYSYMFTARFGFGIDLGHDLRFFNQPKWFALLFVFNKPLSVDFLYTSAILGP